MGDHVSHANMEVTTMMQDFGGRHKANPSTEFKFGSNSFDGLKFLCDHLNAIEDVEKVKTIGAQQLTQNIGAYLMRCVVMTRGLFEVGDTYEHNEIRRIKEMTQLKDTLKVHTDKVEELNKQLSEVNRQKEISKSKCLDLETTISGLIQDFEKTQEANETLNKYLQEAQVDLLSADDDTFNRTKAQALCLKPDLNVSEMDYFNNHGGWPDGRYG